MDYGNAQRFELDDYNLNANEWDSTPGRDPRSMGNKAISTVQAEAIPAPSGTLETPRIPETPQLPEAPRINVDGYTPELGQIAPGVPYTGTSNFTPPQEALNSEIVNSEVAAAYDKKSLKTTDRLDPQAVQIIDGAINEFKQDGDIAKLYNTARDMMETHLDNSYNRKLAV